jgi:hypothetical protein
MFVIDQIIKDYPYIVIYIGNDITFSRLTNFNITNNRQLLFLGKTFDDLYNFTKKYIYTFFNDSVKSHISRPIYRSTDEATTSGILCKFIDDFKILGKELARFEIRKTTDEDLKYFFDSNVTNEPMKCQDSIYWTISKNIIYMTGDFKIVSLEHNFNNIKLLDDFETVYLEKYAKDIEQNKHIIHTSSSIDNHCYYNITYIINATNLDSWSAFVKTNINKDFVFV